MPIGRWRIIESEVWDQGGLDHIVPADTTFIDGRLGHFQMIVIEGGLDRRFEGKPRRVLLDRGTTTAGPLQALWSEEQGLPIGLHRRRPLGSRLAMPAAKHDLLNYPTDTIREAVRCEVLDPARVKGKLFGQPRILNDLLPSQPHCCNLFGELRANLDLAKATFHQLMDGRVHTVTAIDVEHSPGRGDLSYMGDRSALDVYVELLTAASGRASLELRWSITRLFSDQPAPHRQRYDEIVDAMGAFKDASRALLRRKPLQQIWRDHLLAGSLLHDSDAGLGDGFFVFLYPNDNYRCAQAVESYTRCMKRRPVFRRLDFGGCRGCGHEGRSGRLDRRLRGSIPGVRQDRSPPSGGMSPEREPDRGAFPRSRFPIALRIGGKRGAETALPAGV